MKKEEQSFNNNGNFVLNLLEKILLLEKKYGFWNILKSLLVIILIILLSYLMINPTFLFKKFEDFQTEKHNVEMQQREVFDPNLRSLLRALRRETKANRVFFFEIHDGIKGSTGFRFRYADMRYELLDETTEEIAYLYENVNMSLYPMFTYVYQKRSLFADMEKMKDIDIKMSKRIKNNGTNYLALRVCYLNGEPKGIIGLSFKNDTLPVTELFIQEKISKTCDDIENLVNKINKTYKE